jgi:WS/DGAT/MGAT family acyltransferase
MWLVEGLAGGRFAVIHRVHHCMVDGISTQDIASAMFSTTPHEERLAVDDWRPSPEPTGPRLVASGLANLATGFVGAVAKSRRWPRTHAATRRALVDGTRALGTLTGVGCSAPHTVLNMPGGPRRRTYWVRQSMDDLRATKSAYGTTINNVVLAATAGALRRYLLDHDQPLVDGFRALVPVSVRVNSERGELGNRISGVYPQLPIHEPDPGRRVALVVAEMQRLRDIRQGAAVQQLMDVGDFMPPTIMGRIQRMLIRGKTHNVLISNVPGVGHRLFLRGRPLVEVLASGLTTERHGLIMPMVSYNGTLFITVGTDPDVVADGARFAAYLEQSFAELHAAARMQAAAEQSQARLRSRRADDRLGGQRQDGPVAARP